MKPYQPVSCDMHSQYELYVMHAPTLSLRYRDKNGNEQCTQAKAIDLLTRRGEEWLVIKTDDGEHSIRLDHIHYCQPVTA